MKMAREMILVPKLKYEQLIHKLDHTKEQSTQAVLETAKTSKKTSEEPDPNITDQLDDTNLLQTGTGYVSTKKVGRPPGISNVRRKKKHIPWITY